MSDWCNLQRGSRNNIFFSFILFILLKSFDDGLVQPLPRRLPGVGMLIHQNHAAGEENGSIMVGMFVCLCFASKKPSEREFFVPAGTDLGVKLLSCLIQYNISVLKLFLQLFMFSANHLPAVENGG